MEIEEGFPYKILLASGLIGKPKACQTNSEPSCFKYTGVTSTG
jgi:hypothetical protein